jgi:V8-like Glu-specific endopeptidase
LFQARNGSLDNESIGGIMDQSGSWKARRRVLRTGAGFSLGSLLAACGGGGGGNTAVSATPAPPPAPVLSQLDAATYMIGYTVQTQGGERTFLMGTGFAIEDNLIATNSHVTKGILDEARTLAQNGIRLTRVTAYQSETGRAFPLLKAVIHPSYTGDTRSPDVGLFESREQLPTRLTLETPEGTTRLRKGDALQQNGFPGDLFDAVFNDFQPGLSVPKATLFTGTIQTIEKFDSRVVVDPANLSTIDMYQHSMDTSGGTSGSPILSNGKVIGVHNSGLSYNVQVAGPNNQTQIRRIPTATGSWGINVKHLHNLVNFYKQGVLEADKSFSLPPPDALLGAQGPGQGAGGTGGGAGSQFAGTVSNNSNPNVTHQIRLGVDQNLKISGTTQWPANPSLGLAARTFTLTGASDVNGRFEAVDNTPEVVPGFRRGVYLGFFNPASGTISGEYYELNESSGELFYFGDWTARR